MTHIVLTTAEWLNFGAIIDVVNDIKKRIQRRRLVNQTINELNQLTDQELRDLGISRGMIHSIAMEAYYDNR